MIEMNFRKLTPYALMLAVGSAGAAAGSFPREKPIISRISEFIQSEKVALHCTLIKPDGVEIRDIEIRVPSEKNKWHLMKVEIVKGLYIGGVMVKEDNTLLLSINFEKPFAEGRYANTFAGFGTLLPLTRVTFYNLGILDGGSERLLQILQSD